MEPCWARAFCCESSSETSGLKGYLFQSADPLKGAQMGIQSRPMRPKDVRGCVEIVAAHPIVGPRYARVISNLHRAWLSCLGSEAFQGCVFEDQVNGSCARLLGAGVRAFVSDQFVREVKTPPFFWVGPELARRVAADNSPLLSDTEVRKANSSGGLNLV